MTEEDRDIVRRIEDEVYVIRRMHPGGQRAKAIYLGREEYYKLRMEAMCKWSPFYMDENRMSFMDIELFVVDALNHLKVY